MIYDIFDRDAERVLSNVDLSFIDGKIILITGASGLIGSNLLYSIKKYVEKYEKTVDVYIVTHSNIPRHMNYVNSYPWIKVLNGDMTDENFVDRLPEADIVFHFATYSPPTKFMSCPEKTLYLNTVAVFKLLDKVKKNGKFLFASSSAVYTGCTETPYREEIIGNSNTDHPRACYIEGKKCGETICNAYRMRGGDAKSIRLSITYGPGAKSNDKRALNMFIEAAIKEKKIKLLDDGSAVKNYLYISDAIEYIWNICLNGKSSVYNVAGHSRTTILDIAKKIGSYLNAEVIAEESSSNGVEGAILYEELSMMRTETEFCKSNYIDLDTGLENVIKYNLDMLKN